MRIRKIFSYCMVLSIVFTFAARLTSEMKLLKQVEESQKKDESLHPNMEFEETLYDFKQITQEQGANHRFIFKNSGNADLVIVDLKSSCGCTAAIASTGPYKPGESGFVETSYDSRAKVGFVYKEVKVYSNDPNSPITVALQGIVAANSHPAKGPGEILFQGSCAECHSLSAQGKSGEKLYDSVCALCHDFPQSVGKPALSGDRFALTAHSKRNLKRIIKEGIPNSSMPAFLDKHGGPLTKKQVDSLVEYLRSLKKEGG